MENMFVIDSDSELIKASVESLTEDGEDEEGI